MFLFFNVFVSMRVIIVFHVLIWDKRTKYFILTCLPRKLQSITKKYFDIKINYVISFTCYSFPLEELINSMQLYQYCPHDKARSLHSQLFFIDLKSPSAVRLWPSRCLSVTISLYLTTKDPYLLDLTVPFHQVILRQENVSSCNQPFKSHCFMRNYFSSAQSISLW